MATRSQAPSEEGATVQLNLDTVERDGGTRPSFSFVIDGHRYEATDPAEVDWQDLLNASPIAILRLTMAEDDYKKFVDLKLPGWKLNTLVASWADHYGLDIATPGALAGNLQASRSR